MDYEAYAEGAMALINQQLDSVHAVRDLLHGRGWLSRQAHTDDLEPLRHAQAELAAVVDRSAAGEEQAVVQLLNSLLARHPIRPQIAGHGSLSWHLHINEHDATAAETLITEALFGLSLTVTELGATRFGRCAAPGCSRAYLDTSPNHSRRYCSNRCATRVNVAAHRRRREKRTLSTVGPDPGD